VTDGLLLLHAWPVDASMWERQVTALGGVVAIAAPNHPGFGGTPLNQSILTMDAAADAAAKAATSQGLDRVVVCGVSIGGYVAFAFWRRHRDRVAGLVLASTRATADNDEGRQRRKDLAERLRVEGNGFMVESPPPLISADAPAELQDYVKSTIARQPAESIAAASLGMAERPDSTGDLPGIDVPTLVIAASGDLLIPPDETKAMAPHIPDARLEVLEGAGHLSNLEAPDEFTRLVRKHLEASKVLEG
jgi:pimeloyl-ACP methyl ester carboxylesterase